MHLLRITFQEPRIRVFVKHGVGDAGTAVNRFRRLMHAFGDILCTVEKTDDGSVVTAHIRILKDPAQPEGDRYDQAKQHVIDSAARLFHSSGPKVVRSHDPHRN